MTSMRYLMISFTVVGISVALSPKAFRNLNKKINHIKTTLESELSSQQKTFQREIDHLKYEVMDLKAELHIETARASRLEELLNRTDIDGEAVANAVKTSKHGQRAPSMSPTERGIIEQHSRDIREFRNSIERHDVAIADNKNAIDIAQDMQQNMSVYERLYKAFQDEKKQTRLALEELLTESEEDKQANPMITVDIADIRQRVNGISSQVENNTENIAVLRNEVTDKTDERLYKAFQDEKKQTLLALEELLTESEEDKQADPTITVDIADIGQRVNGISSQVENNTENIAVLRNEVTDKTDQVAPEMEDKCALESVMPRELAAEELKGLYYGAYPNSRTEYTSLPASLRIKSAFSMNFRTTASDGVIFYFADTKRNDHVSIIMKDGTIRYTFNCGTGNGVIVSPDTFNDGAWHMLEVGRTIRYGIMQIDGDVIGTANSKGRGRSIDGRSPYFFGGVNADALTNTWKANLDNVLNSFQGCLANVKLNGIDIGEAPVQNGTIPCSDVTETGAYFYDNGGYIQIIDSFNVGRYLKVELEIKPRSMDGVLFSVHGSKGNFVLLQMIEGKLQFRVDNDAGPIIADHVPAVKGKLCDGMWHKIVAIKNKNVVFLTVDKNNPVQTESSGSTSFTDTNNPVYLGGKPDTITEGVRAKGSYLGCMRNIVINNNPQYPTTGVVFDSVDVNSCPID